MMQVILGGIWFFGLLCYVYASTAILVIFFSKYGCVFRTMLALTMSAPLPMIIRLQGDNYFYHFLCHVSYDRGWTWILIFQKIKPSVSTGSKTRKVLHIPRSPAFLNILFTIRSTNLFISNPNLQLLTSVRTVTSSQRQIKALPASVCMVLRIEVQQYVLVVRGTFQCDEHQQNVQISYSIQLKHDFSSVPQKWKRDGGRAWREAARLHAAFIPSPRGGETALDCTKADENLDSLRQRQVNKRARGESEMLSMEPQPSLSVNV